MKTLGVFGVCLVFAIFSSVVVEGFGNMRFDINPLQPPKSRKVKNPVARIPKYVMKKFEENMKKGRGVNLQCIFPKILRTKRAIKLVFKKDSFKETGRWQRDEIRIFMSTAKGNIASSDKPYYVKIFDLYSKRLMNTYKFSSKDYGWKTINLTGWRSIKTRHDRKGRKFGLKIVVAQGKRKLNINKTAFRKNRNKMEPYFIEYFHGDEERVEPPNAPADLLRVAKQHESNYNKLPASKYELTKFKRGYFIPFQEYDIGLGKE